VQTREVSRLRTAMRRLDPWAALVLGGLLAMGVVILLATPGPWQKVVGTEAPVHLEAPAPEDVAVFVMAGKASTCSGVLWLHVDTARRTLTAVVVARTVSGFSPTDGYAPICDIVDSVGPGAAAQALGGALGVGMDAWVVLDRSATDLAIDAMVPMSDVRAVLTRYREARAAWRGRGSVRVTWPTQYETLSLALPQVPFQDLGVVAFANYVLGFGFVRTDLNLQGVTSLGEALRDVDPSRVQVRAAPVVIERSRRGEVWGVDASAVEPLWQSVAIGIVPPETGRLVTVQRRSARVLVVAPFARRPARRYAARVRAALARSAGAPVEVGLVSGTDTRLAFRAARELDRRPALAVLVAPGGAGVPAVRKVYAMLRQRQQQAVVSGPLPDQSGAAEARAAAESSGLPVSWLPETSPVGAGGSGSGGSGTQRVELPLAAVANVQTLVRACWPGTLAPTLQSTKLGFTFVEARHTGAGVVSKTQAAAAHALEQLRLWGFPAARLTLPAGSWRPPAAGPLVCYRAGSHAAAAALAGDLGLPAKSVVRSDDAPRDVVLVLPD
jgi:hypothetical protein